MTPDPDLDAYKQAVRRSHALIDRSPPPKDPIAVRERAIARMERLRKVLAALGDPHLRYPVIHVAGTSGKGSTAVATAAILSEHGIRTGLHTSPYLQSATEKLVIGSELISGRTLLSTEERVLSAAATAGIEHITYGELWFALVSTYFAESHVDAAVIEVGAGGRFDLTNVVAPAVTVITSVGLDHMDTLGTTIPEIAWHKAGIIKTGAPVISAVSDPEAIAVIAREAEQAGTTVARIERGVSYEIEILPDRTVAWWEIEHPNERYRTPTPGRYQAANAATALAAVRALPGFDGLLRYETTKRALRSSRFQGRFETVQVTPKVVLDGAHNPQKMAALVRDLGAGRLQDQGGQLIVVFGVLESKSATEMLQALAEVADSIILSTPDVFGKPGADPHHLAELLALVGFAGAVEIVPAAELAIESALQQAKPDDVILVTGSLYLVGNVRGRWFDDDQIVIQKTPWPVATAEFAGRSAGSVS